MSLGVVCMGDCQAEVELSEAEPALLLAKKSVRSIKKPQLDEIRTLTRCVLYYVSYTKFHILTIIYLVQ